VFYTQQRIEKCQSIGEVAKFFQSHPRDAFVFTTAEQYPSIAEVIPSDVQVIERSPRFLKHGDVLLLSRVPDQDSRK
jgi:hypothetical protein